MPLQEWIHNLEEGKGAVWIKRIFVFLAFAGIAAVYNVRHYKNFATPEAMDSAQVARQLASGQGFTTKFVRPFSLKLMVNHQGEGILTKEAEKAGKHPLRNPHPDLAHAPVFPLIEAGLMKALPFNFAVRQNFWRFQPEIIIAIFNQLLFAAILVSLFILSRRLFDPGVAAVTVAVTALAEIFWRFTIAGLPTMLLMLITVWIVYFLSVMESQTRDQTAKDRSFYAMAFGVGLLLALGSLTRYSYGFLLLPILIFSVAFFGTRRGASTAIIIVIFVAALTPWCYRNYTISGQPFGTAQFAPVAGTVLFPKDRLERSMPQSLRMDLNKVTPNQYGKKLLTGLSNIIRNEVPKLGGSWVTALFLVGLLAPFRNPGLSRLRWFLLGAMGLFAIVQSLGRTHLSEISPEINSENFLILLAPLVFMYGIALFYSFIDQIAFEFARFRTAVITTFVVIVSAPLLLTFASGRTIPFAFPPYYPPYIQEHASWLRADEVAMSDMPWAMAWYGDRVCVWNTLDTGYAQPSDFFAINDHMHPIKLLYLTPLSLDVKFVEDMLKGRENAWSRFALDSMIRTNVPPGFPLKHSPRGYLPDFLILSDRKRW
jgi:4-amino-4-deoxy-L-arabinose transferase-like glycosyltransferase